ncbi:DUF2846 domain-containing protein [Marinicellulosiphila megalodicopiae]|uniref:DUF2846 domain-containing protein n=1 Tax=Marinicellulosiphila megalodicopiae TaxID=2724896 RepID=UPI003BB00E72
MKLKIALILMTSLILASCVSMPAAREVLQIEVPALDADKTRIYMSSGKYKKFKLKSVYQVGPVLLSDKVIGSTARDEYFVVDTAPGEYELTCTSEKQNKILYTPSIITLEAGETRYFSCNMKNKGAGLYFGIIGMMVSKYLFESFVVEGDSASVTGNLVSYEVM